MNRCATCKFWQPFDLEKVNTHKFGSIRHNKLGLCEKIEDESESSGYSYAKPPIQPKDVLAALDDPTRGGGSFTLRTAAHFGCVLHEAKESP